MFDVDSADLFQDVRKLLEIKKSLTEGSRCAVIVAICVKHLLEI